MTTPTPNRLPPEPPARVPEALRKRLPSRDQDAFTAMFMLRNTAQQVENVLASGWRDGRVGGTFSDHGVAIGLRRPGRAA
jgi:hypothetical protein